MLKRLVATWLQARRRHGFERFHERCHDVVAPQEELLLRLVARNGQTALARRLGVPGVRSLKDMSRLPLTDYDAIAPEIEKALAGEPDQLVPGRPAFFGMTSGTSGRAKYLPIDEAYRAEFQAPVQHFLYGIVRDHPEALAEKALYLTGPAVLETTPGGAEAGTISGYNLRRLPRLLKRFYAVPEAVAEIRDPAAQAYAAARFALAGELSIAFAVTTAPLALIGSAMERHSESLLRDIRDGTLRKDGVPDAIHAALTQALRPDARRTRLLEARIAGGKRPIPRHFFPTMRLIACWHHASAASHLTALRDLWGEVPLRSAIYSATEAWLNVPLSDAHPSGVLACDAVVAEFMDASGKIHLAHELTEPGRYELIITSGAGLWRYRLGDEVEVTGFFEQLTPTRGPSGRAPELRFVQKTGNVLSLAHDMTSEAHVVSAVARAMPHARRWVFGPNAASDRYRVVVEGGASEASAALASALDQALAAANVGYQADRELGLIQPLELVPQDAAVFDAWEAARRRAVMAQAKPTVFVKTFQELP